MVKFIFFTIGAMFGGLVGIVTMCLLQINRLREGFHGKENEPDGKEND